LALGLANLFGCIVLLTIFWTAALPGHAGSHRHEQLIGPLVAVMWLIGLVPFLRYTVDVPRSRLSPRASLKGGLSSLRSMLRKIGGNHDALRYFCGRALYQDAFIAFLSFVGVFAAGVMRWKGPELMIFGAAGVGFGALGGATAGWLDAFVGPKNALRLELWGMTVLIAAMIGTGPDRIAFLIPATRTGLHNWPLLGSTADIAFALFGFLALMCQMAGWSSSRTLLIEVAPISETGSYFGLATVSGTATAWLAPTLIGITTAASGSQQAGFIPIIVLLFLGSLLIGSMRR
jgi:UMF1 family MFS transporter